MECQTFVRLIGMMNPMSNDAQQLVELVANTKVQWDNSEQCIGARYVHFVFREIGQRKPNESE